MYMLDDDYEFIRTMFIKYFSNYRNYEINYLRSLLGDDNTTGDSYLKLRTYEMDSDYITFMSVLKNYKGVSND